LKAGLKKAAARKLLIAGISTDSWGVDYLLLDAQGKIMSPTFHYRDARSTRGVARVKAVVDWPASSTKTGIQFMPLNTIYQLAAEPTERLAGAAQMLMIADAFNYFLSGAARIEESNASTSQLYNPRTKQWSSRLLNALNLSGRLFPPIVPSGTRLGQLRKELSDETGLPQIDVIASCSHDTGAAVAGSAGQRRGLGVSQLGHLVAHGVERPAPLVNDAAAI